MFQKAPTGTSRNSNSPRTIFAIAIWATMAVSYYLYATQKSELVTIAGFTLHITDLLFAFIAIYCLSGALSRWRSSAEIILLLLCALLVLSFIRGAVGFEVNSAGVEFRRVAVFVVLVFFIYFWGDVFRLDWIYKNIIVLGWAIVALAWVRGVFGYEIFILEEVDWYAPWAEPRSLNDAAALMLGTATLITLNKALSEVRIMRRWLNGLAFIIFMLTLLISQQRTAILATLTGLAVITAFPLIRYRSSLILIGILVIVGGGTLLLAAWIDLGNDLIDYFPRVIKMIIFQEATYGDRTRVWDAYLNNYLTWPIVEQILGRPFGGPIFAIMSSTNKPVELSPHNGYVQLLLRVGLLGVFVFVLVLFYALAKGFFVLIVTASHGDPSPLQRLAVAIIASQTIFSLTYLLPNEQGLLLAIAFQTISRVSRAAAKTSPMLAGELIRRLRTTSRARL